MMIITSDMSKVQIIEAIQECIYDLERDGNLIDAGAVRISLDKIKQMDENTISRAVENLYGEFQEQSNDMADYGR